MKNALQIEEKLRSLAIASETGETFEPLTLGDIEGLERSLGRHLPCDYRWFLMHFGATQLEVDAVHATAEGGIIPGFFFGRNIGDEIEDYRERLPDYFIPINDDGGGNIICISLQDQSYGSLWFHNHSVGADDDTSEAKLAAMVLLAPSFTQFIIGLRSLSE